MWGGLRGIRIILEENRFIQAIEKLAPNLGHVKTYLVVKLGHSKDPIKGITRKNMRQKRTELFDSWYESESEESSSNEDESEEFRT